MESIKASISTANFNTWFVQTFIVSVKELPQNRLRVEIGCPSSFIRDTVENRYWGQVQEVLDQATGKKCEPVFIVKQNPEAKKENGEEAPLFVERGPAPEPSGRPTNGEGLNSRFTFDSFVVGSANNFAHAAAQGIIKNPGQSYNPFFIWGGVGVGKTHLIQAIGNALSSQGPERRILYASAETFTNELIGSLQKKTTGDFKKRFRSVDVLLIDDVQFIAGKEYVQEEFFHTFNALYMRGRQIALTSDRPPEEMARLEERLSSRFMGGLMVDIQPPDYEMRVAILKQKCQEQKTALSEAAIDFLATRISSNVRELEGGLSRVLSAARATGEEPTEEFVRKFFGARVKPPEKRPAPRSVIAAVAHHFNFRTGDLLGKSRKADLVLARQVAMYLLREELEMPLMEVGQLIGGRDHTTIMHGVEKIKNQFANNQKVRHEVVSIRQALYQ